MAWKSTYKVRENKAQPTLAILWMTVKEAIDLHKWLVSCLHSETMLRQSFRALSGSLGGMSVKALNGLARQQSDDIMT